jgi:hypothetical protein
MAALTTVPNVELATVGVWYTSTGVWDCTPEQLADCVRAQDDPTFRTAVLKVGHQDGRFNASADGEPGVGRVTNLRLSPDGLTLLGDLTGVPAWLAEIIPSAYPSRSIEMNLDVVTATGQTYAGVLTGLALLGVTAPAIESLADVAALYEQPTAVDAWVSARAVAASMQPAVRWPPLPDLSTPMTNPTDGDPMPAPTVPDTVRAAASIDTLRTAFYDWVQTQEGDATILDRWAWICDVWTDAVVADDDDGHLWRTPYTEADGVFTFGTPTRVTITYVPVADTVAARGIADVHRPLWKLSPDTDTITARAIATGDRAVRSARGRDDRAASAIIPKEQALPDTPAIAQQVRERLGLASDVDDDAVLAALDALKAKPAADPTIPSVTDPVAPVVDADASDLDARIAARVAAAQAPLLAQLTTMSGELAARKAAEKVTRRETVLASALAAGKITPASRDAIAAQYDAAPDVVEAMLGAIADGTAMPVKASGVVGGEPASDDDAFYASLFGAPAAKAV